MPDIPARAVRLQVAEFLEFKPNAHKRIIDPNTLHQYEISHEEVNLICPICSHVQASPACEDTDYQCPKCSWRYKLIGDMLVLWHPGTVGIDLPAHAPGYNPFSDTVVDGGGEIADPARAAQAREYANNQWVKAQANKDESFGKKIQIIMPEKKGG